MWTSSAAGLLLLAATSASANDASLSEIRQRGELRVAVYRDFAPFSDHEQGIDVELARSLAQKLGVRAEVSEFTEADDVSDDLRNVVWKGHYLRKGQLADVMMHVPVDPALARDNEQTRIFAPYFREQLVVARNTNRIPQLATLEVFTREKVGVLFETIEDEYLLSTFGGRLRANVTHFRTMAEAVAAMRKGDIAAVMGSESKIDGALTGADKGFAVARVATPGLKVTGWDVGLAVKAERTELAAALERALGELRRDGSLERLFAAGGVRFRPPASPVTLR